MLGSVWLRSQKGDADDVLESIPTTNELGSTSYPISGKYFTDTFTNLRGLQLRNSVEKFLGTDELDIGFEYDGTWKYRCFRSREYDCVEFDISFFRDEMAMKIVINCSRGKYHIHFSPYFSPLIPTILQSYPLF